MFGNHRVTIQAQVSILELDSITKIDPFKWGIKELQVTFQNICRRREILSYDYNQLLGYVYKANYFSIYQCANIVRSNAG